jgi:hypothetical protein
MTSIQDNIPTDYLESTNLSDIVGIERLEQLLSVGYRKDIDIEEMITGR